MSRTPFVVLVLVWLLWTLAFVVRRKRGSRVRAATSKVSVWGILLQSISYGIVWSNGRVGPRTMDPWRFGALLLFSTAALLLIWTAIPALGKQWRLEAGLNVDHELVQKGPYRFLRHPIYASMLAMLLATCASVGKLRPALVAVVLFLAGTEIRVRAEDRLLADRFGERFEKYRQRVRAYVPWVR